MLTNKILKSKRGVAIENAILFIIVIFMLCALLSSITLIAHYQFKIDNTVLANDVDLDQIGEDFIAFLESGETNFDNFLRNNVYKDRETDYERIYTKKYKPSITGNLLTVAPQGDPDSVIFRVRASLAPDGNGGVKAAILTWNCPSAEDEVTEYDSLDRIGNEFISHIENSVIEVFAPADRGYVFTVIGDTLIVKNGSSVNVFYISLDDNKIEAWRYGGPEEGELGTGEIEFDGIWYSVDSSAKEATVYIPTEYEGIESDSKKIVVSDTFKFEGAVIELEPTSRYRVFQCWFA